MRVEAFILVFISVFMHAAWNFLSKKNNPSMAFYFLAMAAGGIFWLPATLFSQIDIAAVPAKFWILMLISNAFEVLYFVSLSHGYKSGDISLVYPLGRSLPVIMVALVTTIFGIGKTPSWVALAGMLIIFCGCLTIPLESWRGFTLKIYRSRVLFWVLMIGAATTGYTIFDSMAMKILNETAGRSPLFKSIFCIFIVQLELTVSLALPAFLNRAERLEMKKIAKTPSPYIVGIFSASAYVLILLAMKFVSNVSYIQAFRQMSLPLGVLAGILILKERCSQPKAVGILLVVGGLVMTAF